MRAIVLPLHDVLALRNTAVAHGDEATSRYSAGPSATAACPPRPTANPARPRHPGQADDRTSRNHPVPLRRRAAVGDQAHPGRSPPRRGQAQAARRTSGIGIHQTSSMEPARRTAIRSGGNAGRQARGAGLCCPGGAAAGLSGAAEKRRRYLSGARGPVLPHSGYGLFFAHGDPPPSRPWAGAVRSWTVR